ncbi:hypothetical protein GPECTOR_44g71 [Gonium pectorale]|uniref:Major facilitator superfamily (MFS) profile domain-containing protein n=1 Tax=Gonium pectorale TaxID=33097 RepID=A0A150G964_GONPE|nr:hypothetical protein GPECTOR_44g71 [Gonium pectorale]|eukprot:KXZ46396.1 hypothetical protein GPECTOR_44g71 [Gonium pectorale]
MFLMTFTYVNPLATGPPQWRCADAADAACEALLQRQQLAFDGLGRMPNADVVAATAAGPVERLEGFCDLSPSRYVWLSPETSFAAEYNLVCGRQWQASLLETLFFAGFMAGNGVFGALADRHGRRATLAACAAATAALTALAASPLVPQGPGAAAGSGGGPVLGYWLHLVVRTCSGVAAAGQALGAYVLATELVGPAWRGAAGMLTQTFFILGEFLLVGLSLAAPPWRRLSVAVALCCGGVLLLVPLAHAALLWVARVNGVSPPPALEVSEAGEVLLTGGRHLHRDTAGAEPLLRGAAEGYGGGPWALAPASPSASPPRRPESSVGGGGGGGGGGRVGRGSEKERLLGAPPPMGAAGRDGSKEEGTGMGGASAAAAEEEEEEAPLPSSAAAVAMIVAAAVAADAGDGWHRRAGHVGTAPARPHTHPPHPTSPSPSTSSPPPPPSLPPPPLPEASPLPAASLLTALAHPVTRRLLLSTCLVLFAVSVAYFGVTLALGSLVGGSLHANFALTAAAELPGYLALAASTDRLGRRAAIGGGTALAGVALLACAFTAGGPAQIAFAMLGKLGCSGAWAVGLTFASELFPTCLRSAALSLASQSGDLGGLVTPALLLLSPSSGPLRRLPFAVMGGLALAAVAAVARLPETRGMPQLDTFPQLLDWLAAQRPAGHSAGKRGDRSGSGSSGSGRGRMGRRRGSTERKTGSGGGDGAGSGGEWDPERCVLLAQTPFGGAEDRGSGDAGRSSGSFVIVHRPRGSRELGDEDFGSRGGGGCEGNGWRGAGGAVSAAQPAPLRAASLELTAGARGAPRPDRCGTLPPAPWGRPPGPVLSCD